MKLTRAAFILTLFAAAPMLFAADVSPMKPGKWRITIQMDIQNVPFKMPAIAVEQCVTPEQAANPEAPKKKRDDCKYSNYKRDGNTLTWSMECKNNLSGEGKISFNGDSYDGTAHLKNDKTEINYQYTGKYLGACD